MSGCRTTPVIFVVIRSNGGEIWTRGRRKQRSVSQALVDVVKLSRLQPWVVVDCYWKGRASQGEDLKGKVTDAVAFETQKRQRTEVPDLFWDGDELVARELEGLQELQQADRGWQVLDVVVGEVEVSQSRSEPIDGSADLSWEIADGVLGEVQVSQEQREKLLFLLFPLLVGDVTQAETTVAIAVVAVVVVDVAESVL